MKIFQFFIIAAAFTANVSAESFNHEHSPWNELVQKHVHWTGNGGASQVSYRGFKKDRAALQSYLQELSAVSRPEFDAWSKDRQLAFLINAYNAFTIELILTKYPDIKSIKELGSLFKSPWKKKFFSLLGKKRHLDWIEHEMIRAPGVYDDPRIHAAVNCASVGCPALRNEAFIGRKLDRQLEDNIRRFLKDRSRNRFNPDSGKLEVSKIFDWYADDFKKGHKGYDSPEIFFGKYADLLADAPAARKKIKAGQVPITFLGYDWGLNDVP